MTRGIFRSVIHRASATARARRVEGLKRLPRYKFLLWLRTLKRTVIRGECFEERGPLMLRHVVRRFTRYNVYLHRLRRSDAGGVYHDHPWGFCSIILVGGYIEETPAGRRRYRAGRVLFRTARWIHRIEVERPAWTLIIARRSSREWGFHTPSGYYPWREYGYADGRCDDEF